MAFASYPSLADRVVLVTGGGSGIGAVITAEFCAQGARVAFIDIDEKASAGVIETVTKAGLRAPIFIRCDLRDIAALRVAVGEVERRLGAVRALINNAARDQRHAWDTLTPELWDELMDVNLRHQFFALQAVVPGMVEAGGGSIVNFGSVSWMQKTPGMPAYTTAKAAIAGLTRVMARELGPQNIRVNAIVPGSTLTEKQVRLWWTAEMMQGFIDRQCLKFHVEPPDIARMALFLAADDSRAITAQSMVVDGGLT
jgi:NAD(P)-dependent dehydrogenase (short-subunit alcohol dehydrogenase family)